MTMRHQGEPMTTTDDRNDARAESSAGAAPGTERRARDPKDWIHREIKKYRKRNDLAFRPDAEFFRLADPVVNSIRTLLGFDRLYVLWQAVGNVQHLDGAVVEIGSYRGGSAYFLASSFLALTGSEARIHVFDTFEGHPANMIGEPDTFHRAGQFGDTNYEDVKAYLSPYALLEVHKGAVSAASLQHLEDATYRLLHIDTDLYQPTLDCLEYFAPRMVSGGVVVVDDYAAPKCPGVPKAVVEYLANSDLFQVWDLRTEQLMLVKR